MCVYTEDTPMKEKNRLDGVGNSLHDSSTVLCVSSYSAVQLPEREREEKKNGEERVAVCSNNY